MSAAYVAHLLPAVGAALVLTGAWELRPGRGRTLDRGPRLRRDHLAPIARIGRMVRRPVGRPPDRAAELRVGAAAIALVGGLLVDPVVGIGAGGAVWASLYARDRRRRERQALRLATELPDLADLLHLAAGAGLTVPLAIAAVAPLAPPRYADELEALLARAGRGQSLAEGLDEMGRSFGATARPLTRVLADSLRYGTDLRAGLERVAADARTERRRAAEIHARRLPVRMLLPLVFCVLPAFALLTVVPVLVTSLDSLGS